MKTKTLKLIVSNKIWFFSHVKSRIFRIILSAECVISYNHHIFYKFCSYTHEFMRLSNDCVKKNAELRKKRGNEVKLSALWGHPSFFVLVTVHYLKR